MITRSVTRPVISPIARALTAPFGVWSPHALFANGEQGVWYDPNDFSTLFQDSAGTIPVTAAGQPVGRMLDKSGRGNHAFIATAASRPMLRQTPILGSELVVNGGFDSGTTGWTAADGTISNPGAVLRVTGTASAFPSGRQQVAVQVGKTYLIEWQHRSVDGTTNSCLFIRPNSYNDATGQVPPQDTLSTTFVARRAVFTATTTSLFLRATVNSGATSASAEFDGISIREITGYYTDRNYLETDGSDDWMSTAAIDFTATDKVTIFAGVRKLSDATQQVLVELSTNPGTTTGSFGVYAPNAGQNYMFRLSGSVPQADMSASVFTSPVSSVLSCAMDIAGAARAQEVMPRVDGAIPTLTGSGVASAGTGNLGNHPLYLFRRAGTTLPFNGHFYGLVIVGRLCSAAETSNTELMMARRTGVSIA